MDFLSYNSQYLTFTTMHFEYFRLSTLHCIHMAGAFVQSNLYLFPYIKRSLGCSVLLKDTCGQEEPEIKPPTPR